jgi:acyl carrier protein
VGDAVELPETLVFDFPTLRQIETHISSQVRPVEAIVAPAASGMDAAMLAQLLGGLQGGSAAAAPTHVTSSTLDASAIVHAVASELLPSASADVPLMEAGLDSLGMVELRNRLMERLGVAELSDTLIFDFPTVRELEAHLCQLVPSTPVPPAAPAAAGMATNMNPALLAQLFNPSTPVTSSGTSVIPQSLPLVSSSIMEHSIMEYSRAEEVRVAEMEQRTTAALDAAHAEMLAAIELAERKIEKAIQDAEMKAAAAIIDVAERAIEGASEDEQ